MRIGCSVLVMINEYIVISLGILNHYLKIGYAKFKIKIGDEKMKKILVWLIVLCVLGGTNYAVAEQSLNTISSKVETKKSTDRIYVHRDEAFSRGIVNMLTCWLEIPRNMINDNYIVMPGLGVLTGFVKGPFYTVGRFGSGFIDFITFGSLENSFYDQEDFPQYVWQADWLGNKNNQH